jgi:hypothetical protein
MRTLTILARHALWLASSTAIAQSPAERTTPARKSENTALAISLGATGGLLALSQVDTRGAMTGTLVFTALLAGPSTGYWYAGSPRWRKGMIVRGITTGVGGLGLMALGQCHLLGQGADTCDVGAYIVVAGMTVFLMTDVVDLFNVREAVREVNEKPGPRVALLPIIRAGGRSAGVAVRVGF